MTGAALSRGVRPTFADFVLLHARSSPNRPAIILADRVATYGMLAQGMLRVEDRLRKLALPAGGLVCVSLDSTIRHLIVAGALFRLGLPVISSADPARANALGLPITAYLHDSGQSMIPGLRQVLVGEDWFVGEDRPLTTIRAGGFADDGALCRVDVSSGSTGRPKAISTTVAAVHDRLINCYATINGGAWSRLLCLPGLNGSWGFTLATHTLRAGRTLLTADSARAALDMIAVYGVDAAAASAQQVRDLVEADEKAPSPRHSLRGLLASGGAMSARLLREARARICANIVIQYGSTELGMTAVGAVDEMPAIEGASGYVAPGVELEAVGERGETLGADIEGVIRIRAPWQGEPFPPQGANANADFRDGWFYPGDRGRIAPDGLLVLAGRANEVINSGGVKLAPEVIEDVLLAHKSIAGAAAFGAAGAGGIEDINVAVVLRAPVAEAAIVEWCRQHRIEVARVFIVPEIPRTDMGKIRRGDLKAQLLA
jgi:acyl-coenzyme A synthetase/AMP-(fatty) acid ligase